MLSLAHWSVAKAPQGVASLSGSHFDYTGKRVYVPFCPVEDPTVMRMLRLRDEEHFTSLPLNRWGIRELAPSEVDQLALSNDVNLRAYHRRAFVLTSRSIVWRTVSPSSLQPPLVQTGG